MSFKYFKNFFNKYMAKKQKILIGLLLIIFIFVLYLILTSESIKPIDDSAEKTKQANAVQLESDYRQKARELFIAYDNLIKSDSFTLENIAALKSNLLNLKVPVKFKELHIRFVLAITKMENYLSQKNEQEKSDSLQAVNQLKADYSWLNQ